MNPRPRRLVLLRHSESERNVRKKKNVYFTDEESRAGIRGIPDHKIDVTPFGFEQSVATGPMLRKKFGVFDYIYHSGYRRTTRTLDGILEAYLEEERAQMKIRLHKSIRERHPGYAYDMTTEEAEAAFPWLKEHWKTFGGFLAQPPGGESIAEVCERVYSFINMLYRDRLGQNILVVTHGGTIRAFRTELERWDYEKATTAFKSNPPDNCSVTWYEFDHVEGKPILMGENEVYWR